MPWVGVLTQKHGDRYRSLSYSGQQLDPVAQGYPPCFRAIVATTVLVKATEEARLSNSCED